jgi:hypothetical protein
MTYKSKGNSNNEEKNYIKSTISHFIKVYSQLKYLV